MELNKLNKSNTSIDIGFHSKLNRVLHPVFISYSITSNPQYGTKTFGIFMPSGV